MTDLKALIRNMAIRVNSQQSTVDRSRRPGSPLLTVDCRLSTSSLHRPGNAAVLPDPPEVDGHQERRDERDPHTVEDVETQERARADKPPAEEAEARVVGGRDELDVADLQQARARPLDADERRRRGHVRSDRDGPDRELVPREQVPG